MRGFRHGLFAALTILVLLVSAAGNAAAVDPTQSKIIDDAVFDNAGSMNVAQINAFLNQFSGSCISPNKGFSAPDPTGYSPTGGYTYGGNVSAGQVIYDAAQAYGLNPQVLLTTLQKEEGTVVGDGAYGCTPLALSAAMGYGCPDGGASYNYSGVNLYTLNGTTVTSVNGTCVNSSSKVGFSQQIIHAAWLFKFGEQRSEGNINWAVIKGGWDNSDDPQSCYSGPMTQGTWQRCPSGGSSFYDGYTTIDGVSVHMDDGATAALYWYTPHFQSFFNIFVGWFGSPYINCIYPPVVANGIYRLYNHGTGNQLLTTSPSEVCAATSVGWLYDGEILNADSSGNGQPVYRLENHGRYLFTASTAERDAAMTTYGYTLDGVAFMGVDPNADPTDARPVYRLASPIGTYLYTISTYERDNMTKYGYRYEGVGFYLKENPAGAAVTPVVRLSNPNGVFLFTISTSEVSIATQAYGYANQGVAFNAITQLNPITVPIYRLSSAKGYLLTTSLIERANAAQAGYHDEGIQMFTYGTMNDTNLKATYRLTRNGAYFYTTSASEQANAQNYGFTVEGVGFLTP